ncbi:MAG: (Fe-S)-binding protein [Gemmataceae bacterium]
MTTSTHPPRSPLPLASPSGENSLGKNIDYETFMDCVHCGLCLGSCPTYVETGNENDSPRGRIYLWRAVADGRAPLTPEAKEHLDLCLECKACETACPSGVHYGEIISSYKKDMARLGKPFPQLNFLQRWMLFHLTPYANRMTWALAPLRMAQRLGLRRVLDTMGAILPRSLRGMQQMVPRLEPGHGRLPEFLPAEGKRRARVMLVVGCAADAFYPRTTVATARVLQRNGCEVLIPRSQGCCGALHYHAGQVSPAQQFAIQNGLSIEKELSGLDAIITNAGGCGPVLKDYGHLLAGTPHEAMGQAFSAKVRDIHEFLVTLGPVAPTHPLPMTATYHDACGLSHGQKIRTQPRQLLGMIPELKLVPLAESEHCCGAAGSYNITQPEMSEEIGKRKARHILATGAEAVFTGNVGCLLQITRYLQAEKPDFWVAHPIEALWDSYSGTNPRSTRSR